MKETRSGRAFPGKPKNRIQKLTALCLLFMMLSCLLTAGAETFECTYAVTYGQTEARRMLDLINDFRTGDDAWYWNSDNETKTVLTDLKSLAYDYRLEAAAMQRAAELAVIFSHTRPDGNSCFTADSMIYGENIAAGYTTCESVFVGWQENYDQYEGQGHRRNMLNSGFTTVGIGHAIAGGIHFWVQNFGRSGSGTNETAAADTVMTVTVAIDDEILSGKSITGFTVSTINLAYEKSTELPMLEAEISRDDYWCRVSGVQVKPAWTSSDADAVSVDGGTATGLAVGKTKLTASLWDYTGSVTVNVTYDALTADMVLPNKLKVIDANAFEGTKAAAVVIPAGVTTISAGAFSSCTVLKQVRFSGKNTEIADGAFPAGQQICFI